MRMLFCLCFLVMPAAAQADQSPKNPAKPADIHKQIDTEQERGAGFASTEGADPQKSSSEPPKRFVPKEHIPAGNAISFPTDI